MRTTESTRKKLELRERFLEYATSHAVNNRIPTVAELRKVLGVTNYMLLNCMNELVREGILVRKSRREGTFLSVQPKRHVIGLILERGAVNEYINVPDWLAGLCSAFRERGNFMLRTIQLQRIHALSDVIRQLGLDAVIANQISWCKELEKFPQIRNKIVFSIPNNSLLKQQFPPENTLSIDQDYWPREYVRLAFRKGCRCFLLLSQPDQICEAMIDEMGRIGMEWHEECLISDPEKFRKKLPLLIRKYHPDAVRFNGSSYQLFAPIFKKFPEFRPLIPFYASDHSAQFMRQEYPYLNLFFPFESLNDFDFRFGLETGRKTMEMILTGRPFPSVRLRMQHAPGTDSSRGNTPDGKRIAEAGKNHLQGVS